MDEKQVAGVAGLPHSIYANGCDKAEGQKDPSETPENPKDCRTFSLREKLRQIRDSDHPASVWARNVVQIMDDLKGRPDDSELLRALGRASVMLERVTRQFAYPPTHLTPEEIASIFGLGDLQ